MSEQSAIANVTTKAASRALLVKLVVFSFSLAAFPLLSFYATKSWIWNGNATYAAITAVFVANIVLVAYIISSILDDRQSTTTDSREKMPELKKKD